MTTVYGFDYNPGGAGNATNHIAIRTTSGSIFFANASGNTPTASTRLDVRGIGTTTNKTFRTASSTNTQTFEILDNANINALPISGSIMTLGGGATASELRFLEPSGSGANYTAFKAVAQGADITYSLPPTVGAAGSKLTDVAGNGVLTWVAGGAGISNTAASNEMMKSDGTNAVPSGLFSTTSGSLDMGTGVAGSERILRAYSSGSDAGITTFMKGVGKFLITGDIAENATISLEYNPSVSDIKYVKIAGANVSGTVGIHSAHGTVTNGSAMDFEILGGNAFAASGLDGGDLNFNPGNKDGAGIDGNIGLLVTTPNFQSGGKIIFVGNNTATPTAAPASGFFHYSNSGVPTWRTSTNNIIFLEKQSAVTTPQGIADALTTLGLLNSSTISGGSGLTYAQTKAIAMKIK